MLDLLETILAAVSVLGLAFGSDPPKAPPTPTPPPDTAAEEARALALADAQKRRGRRSTILTRPTKFGLNGSQGSPSAGLTQYKGNLRVPNETL